MFRRSNRAHGAREGGGREGSQEKKKKGGYCRKGKKDSMRSMIAGKRGDSRPPAPRRRGRNGHTALKGVVSQKKIERPPKDPEARVRNIGKNQAKKARVGESRDPPLHEGNGLKVLRDEKILGREQERKRGWRAYLPL